jgi:transposase
MTIVSHAYSFVIGVDTHARNHTLAILAAPTGEHLASDQFPATDTGMRRAVAWARRRTHDDPGVMWVVEGVGTYGARLARLAAEAGHLVTEAARMDARANRGTGKSDPLDARRIAASVLALDTDRLRHPRADDGTRAALRTLTTAREHMTTERTSCVNALTALLRVTDLGIDARRPLTAAQISQAANWRTRTEDLAPAIARAEATRLAKRVTALDADLAANRRQITLLVADSPAAPLLDKTGVGPITAAIAYTVWSHPGRVRDEATFASLAGVNPIPASSGNTTRHRLNRGGDRRLNAALHIAVITRMTHDPETQTYVAKRTTEGRTKKEIRRILKRYLARQIYRTLNATPTPA